MIPPKLMVIGIAIIAVVAVFSWPAISPETAPEFLKDITTTIVGDYEYVTLTFRVDTWYGLVGQQMYADITYNGARWTDKKGWDAQWFTTSSEVVAYIDVQYKEKTYSYSENFGRVSTFSKETHRFDIVTHVTNALYEEYGAGPIYYSITVKEGNTILKNGIQTGSFTMQAA